MISNALGARAPRIAPTATRVEAIFLFPARTVNSKAGKIVEILELGRSVVAQTQEPSHRNYSTAPAHSANLLFLFHLTVSESEVVWMKEALEFVSVEAAE